MRTTHVAALAVPAQHVDDVAAEFDAIPQHAMFAWCEARGDRCQRSGCGGRRDRSDRRTLHRCQRWSEMDSALQLLPPKAIDHEHHNLIGLRDGRRHPRWLRRTSRRQQRRDDASNVGA